MISTYNVIKKPIATERSDRFAKDLNQYVFQVDSRANKQQIKDAVQHLFKVEVDRVRTSNYDGKLRRLSMGKPQGRRISWKKAIVSVKKGQTIKLDQEVAG